MILAVQDQFLEQSLKAITCFLCAICEGRTILTLWMISGRISPTAILLTGTFQGCLRIRLGLQDQRPKTLLLQRLLLCLTQPALPLKEQRTVAQTLSMLLFQELRKLLPESYSFYHNNVWAQALYKFISLDSSKIYCRIFLFTFHIPK